MSKGPKQPDKVTNVSEPWSGLVPSLQDILGQSRVLNRAGPGFAMPDFNPLQLAAQQGMVGYAGDLQNTTQNANAALNFGLTDVLNPSSNPYLSAYMDTATQPLQQAFSEQILPGISRGSTQTGNFSSTRRGIAEGIAGRGLLDAMGDVTARIGSQGYGQGLQHQARALALTPQTMQSGTLPFSLAGNIGDLYQQQSYERQIDPYRQLEWYSGQVNPYFGGYGSSTQNQIGNRAWLTNALGGGVGGAGLASMMGLPMAPLAIMGGLFGALS